MRTRLIFAAAMALGVSACASTETVSRNAPIEATPLQTAARAPSGLAFNVSGFQVDVPESLTVVETSGYYPNADIVWRGDAQGNRHNQIEAIFEQAAAQAAAATAGNYEVVAVIEVVRFHGVTERTRYTTGGVYDIDFVMSFVDPVTGAVVSGPTMHEASLRAPGGVEALQLEQAGQTEKVRVLQHLTNYLAQQFATAATV